MNGLDEEDVLFTLRLYALELYLQGALRERDEEVVEDVIRGVWNDATRGREVACERSWEWLRAQVKWRLWALVEAPTSH